VDGKQKWQSVAPDRVNGPTSFFDISFSSLTSTLLINLTNGHEGPVSIAAGKYVCRKKCANGWLEAALKAFG